MRAVKNSLSGVIVSRVSGILNGTCNYILSEMLRTGAAYETVLAEAQRLGYAESDPFLDVSGGDAPLKVLILAAISFAAQAHFLHAQIGGLAEIQAIGHPACTTFN